MTNNHQEAAAVFSGQGQPISALNISPIKGGLINYSYLVKSIDNAPFLLQQINSNVFKDPVAVEENYITVWKAACNGKDDLRIPRPVSFRQGSYLYQDSKGGFWRASEFINGSVTEQVAATPEQAGATAKSFARFTAAMKHVDISRIKTVIPDFHNLAFRFYQLQTAIGQASKERLSKADQLVHALLQREQYKNFYEHIIHHPVEYPVRLMHHDAKIANVLFDQTGNVICPVDFDTVMPGHFFSDLGDMIRSMACNHDENFSNIDEILFRPAFYEAILGGYLEVMQTEFTASELANIHYAGVLMIYMQAIRFLADYLQNDTYYQIEYPSQNHDRAANQLALLKQLENYIENHYAISIRSWRN